MLNERIAVSKQYGFTLIELVMVIVILGILAVFALPRFADLRSNSNIAALQGIGGAIKSAASIVHSKAIVKGVQDLERDSVDLDGDGVDEVNIRYGYPTAERKDGIPKIMGGGFENDWAWSTRGAPNRFFLTTASLSAKGIPGPTVNVDQITKNNCYLRYYRANSPGESPTITYFTDGC